MIKIDDIVGDVVYIAFREPERLKEIGIAVPGGNFLVKGFDQYGLWINHPGLFMISELDKNGKPIPPSKQKKEQVEANFLVTWDNILTIMHYPDREGFDFPSEFNKSFGFDID